MKKTLFLNLVAALSLGVVTILVLGATLGTTGAQPAVEAGTRPAEAMELPPPADGTALATGLPDFSRLVEVANPAVVTVTSRQFSTVDESDPHGGDPFRFFRNPFGDPDKEKEDEEPRRRMSEGGGSGFLIASNGYVLTNFHVIEDADDILVQLEDGRELPAFLMGLDRHTDVALLKIDAEGLPALPLGDSDALRVGEWVVAIGSPIDYDHSVTAGVVSAKERDVPLSGVDGALSEFIQTDAAINFGNSGGPLLNIRGEVVGINTAITRGNRFRGDPRFYTGVVQGIGFALPINDVQAILGQLQSSGRVERGYMGVSLNTMQPIDNENWRVFGLPGPGGALIAGVERDRPADRAGLEPGDVVVELNGRKVSDNEDLIRRVSSLRPGERVDVGVVRYGEAMSFEITLGDRGSAVYGGEQESRARESSDKSGDDLGFEVEPLDDEFRDRAGLDDVEGVRVSRVEPGSLAYEAGLRELAVIVEVDRAPVSSVAEFGRAVERLRSGETVSLRLALPGGGRGVVYQFLFMRVP